MLGRRSASTDTALRLGRYFGTSPEFWLALQTRYQRESIAAVGRLLGQDPSLDEAGADALEASPEQPYPDSLAYWCHLHANDPQQARYRLVAT